MSDFVIRIIPTDPYYKSNERSLQRARDLLEDKIDCDLIRIRSFEKTSFIDCGGNLHRISCPKCGKEVGFDWWGEQMSKAYANSFVSLDVCLPCCNKEASLNDLVYDFQCGFACCVLEVLNPRVEISHELLDQIEKIISSSVRIINAHI